MSKNKFTRRNFLKHAGCGAMGTTTLFSTLANLMTANKMLASQPVSSINGDYKALVCVLLAGGNDSYNMLVPRGNNQNEYNDYAATRSDLALSQNQLLPINPLVSDGKEYGIHPAMNGMQSMFENENLAFIANVGTLIEPVANATEYASGLKNLPLGLFSHSDQIQQWQTATPHSREAIGWGGRIADILQSQNTNQAISMNISLSGRNVYQAGETLVEYSISEDENDNQGIKPMNIYLPNSGFLNDIRDDAIKDLAGEMYANIFKQTLGTTTTQSIEALETFKNAIDAVPEFNTSFSQTSLSKKLRMMAKTIAAKDDLGVCRQTFFVTLGGWDHHDEVLQNQQFLLGIVDNAIKEFFDALTEIGMEDNVTLFTISDFARTLTSNGNGSDHAWGGNMMVAGGAVKGKKIYGEYPSLNLAGNPLMIDNRGNLIPTTSADEYFAELALWFGVSPNDLSIIFPNLSNFYVPEGFPIITPLGFLCP